METISTQKVSKPPDPIKYRILTKIRFYKFRNRLQTDKSIKNFVLWGPPPRYGIGYYTSFLRAF